MKNSNYWYARGYYDGRANGFEARPDDITDQDKHDYASGYLRGVTDFCLIDETEQEDG